MKRKASSDIDDICRSVKKLKVEDNKEETLIRCDICDVVYEEECCVGFLCVDCYYDDYEESEEESTISE